MTSAAAKATPTKVATDKAHQFQIKKKIFAILVGGPGLYDAEDKAHDKAWYNYIDPVLQAAKAGTLAKKNEWVYVYVYAPAYAARWKDDIQDPSFWEKHIQDSDLSLTRHGHTKRVSDAGASDYLDYIEKKAKEYQATRLSIVRIQSASEFWIQLEAHPNRSISRIWYVGHAATEGLWLTLYHDESHTAVMRSDKLDKEVIKISDIENNVVGLLPKLASKSQHKFYACNTDKFAKTWSEALSVEAEGSKGSVFFNVSGFKAIEGSSQQGWKTYSVPGSDDQ